MYAYFKGMLADKEDDAVIIDVNGIGYRIYTTLNVINNNNIGDNITLYTYTCVREDAFILYGFESKSALKLYKMLINVSGIGPKLGLAIMSSTDVASLQSAIVMQDTKYLSSTPGIGAKTAGRIVLELKDKISSVDIIDSYDNDTTLGSQTVQIRTEAYEALTGLGLPPIQVNKILNDIPIDENTQLEILIKQVLSQI